MLYILAVGTNEHKKQEVNMQINQIINISEDSRFLIDLDERPHIARFSLISSIGALKLWNKGIKPNRHWKISQVKKYFGMNGNKELLLAKLETLNEIIKGEI